MRQLPGRPLRVRLVDLHALCAPLNIPSHAPVHPSLSIIGALEQHLARCSSIYASVEIVMIICRDVALDTNGDECCKGRERSMCNPRYCWARRRREQWNQLHGLPDRAVVPRRVQFLCAMRPRDIFRRGGVCVVHVVLLRQLRSSRKFAMLSVRGWIRGRRLRCGDGVHRRA